MNKINKRCLSYSKKYPMYKSDEYIFKDKVLSILSRVDTGMKLTKEEIRTIIKSWECLDEEDYKIKCKLSEYLGKNG